MTLGAPPPRLRVAGEVRVLGDKSISHRALLLGAVADGETVIRGVLRSADIESTARALQALGIALTPLAAETRVTGRGLHGLRPAPGAVDCGNSGTTARLLLGLLAAHPFGTTLTGDSSLSRRPMRRVADPLRAMGATVELPATHDGLPLTITGAALREISWRTPVASAQIKSAILLAALSGRVPVTIEEPYLSRDHTERMLTSLGVRLASSRTPEGGARVTLQPMDRIPPLDLTIPGDPSSAAFFAALGCLAEEGEIVLRDISLNPTRTGFIGVLERMGAIIEAHALDAAGEPVGNLVVRSSNALAGTEITADEVPSLIDEIPLLACVASRAAGETLITGAGDLRAKESDRIAAIVANLRAVGGDADELPDGLRVRGKPGARFRGRVRTFGDHRIAMAFAILGAASGGEIEIDDTACVAVSYPDFWRDLARLTA